MKYDEPTYQRYLKLAQIQAGDEEQIANWWNKPHTTSAQINVNIQFSCINTQLDRQTDLRELFGNKSMLESDI
jgi:hypothetical protein